MATVKDFVIDWVVKNYSLKEIAKNIVENPHLIWVRLLVQHGVTFKDLIEGGAK